MSMVVKVTMSVHLSHSLLRLFPSSLFRMHSIEPFLTDFLVCQSTCLNPFLPPPVWTACLFLLFVTSLYLFVFLRISVLSVSSVRRARVCVSQRDPRLSMQPVMRCMLQSACEELIRKQQRPSHINRHEHVCVYGEGVKAREPPWHTYGCLSTNGGIDLEGKADRNEF